ncbi:formyltransferase family protein [Candidatus Coxiella mudrowiae]|uniref:formyltransferase family protein n=1 Tax=Candidatus Coxiella mudrowiae TaxID=2054173 RepID=UPI00352D31C6
MHPALLPKYPGLDTHARVLMAGDREHGVSVYYVTETVDERPIICHAKLLVSPNDTLENLHA